MNAQTALLMLRMLNMLASGIQMTRQLRADYEGYSATIQTMIEEDRGPTDAEIAELLATSDALTERLRAARDARTEIPVEEG